MTLAFDFLLAFLSWRIIRADLAQCEISTRLVIATSLLMALRGILYPGLQSTPDTALAMVAISLAIATFLRALMHLRTGVPAFGGADIALMAGIGGWLGPALFGPWMGMGAALGLGSFLLWPRSAKTLDIEMPGRIVPLCPAMLAAAWMLHLGGASFVSP